MNVHVRIALVFVASVLAAMSLAQTRKVLPVPREPLGALRFHEPVKEGPMDLSGVYSNVRMQKNIVIRDGKAFAALWKEHVGMGQAPMPNVDFAKHDVIAVFIGPKPTGGYSVKIDEIKRTKTSADVNATLLKPGPGVMTTQAFTYPFAMKAVPKLPASVKFNVKEQVAPAPR